MADYCTTKTSYPNWVEATSSKQRESFTESQTNSYSFLNKFLREQKLHIPNKLFMYLYVVVFQLTLIAGTRSKGFRRDGGFLSEAKKILGRQDTSQCT